MSNLFRINDQWVPSDGINTDEISDGHHTFGELYDHRRALTAALASITPDSWRSRHHHPEDTPIYKGYFIVGIPTPGGCITYHYADQYWDDFRNVRELEQSPRWDGAPPESTVTRLVDWARS